MIDDTGYTVSVKNMKYFFGFSDIQDQLMEILPYNIVFVRRVKTSCFALYI